MNAADSALVALGRELLAAGYVFTTVTPLTHDRVNRRSGADGARSVTDVFGWSRPFHPSDLPERMTALLEAAGQMRNSGAMAQSAVRFASIEGLIFAHSAFPTTEPDAVFFGPDTYRFVRALKQVLRQDARPRARVLDIGSGSGAGGIYAGSLLPGDPDLILSDISDKALHFSQINAAINGRADVITVSSDLMQDVDGTFDLIISNPPYLADRSGRLYRNGGGELGGELSLKIVEQAMGRLNPGGRLVLYTGSAVVNGVDRLRARIAAILDRRPCTYVYEEIDPDIFGEELEHAPYDQADRIAAVLLNAQVY